MSAGDRLFLRTIEENILHSVMLELTYACNLDCFFCYNDTSATGKRLTLDDYRRLLEDLASMQVLYLALTGGEPLAHPDFMEIGREAKRLGFAVRIKSNGHALRGALAQKIRYEIDPWILDISLHGASAATHDRQTRVPGSFERLMANIPELLGLGLPVNLNATLTSWNEAELHEMLELADQLGVALNLSPTVSPRDDGSREPLGIRASETSIQGLFEALTQKRRDAGERGSSTVTVGAEDESLLETPYGKNCATGASTLTIDPFGNVLPCVQWRRTVGSLHDASIKEIWTSSQELADVRRLNEEAGQLKQSGGDSRRSFCLGLAVEATGDPLAVYESAQIEGKAREQAETESRATLLPIVD